MTFTIQQHSFFSAGIRWTTGIQAQPRRQSDTIRSQTANPTTQDSQSSKATLERQP